MHPAVPDGRNAWQIVSYTVPMVVEQTSRGERGYDIFSLLLKNRIVFLGTPIDDVVSNLIVAQLLYMAQDDPDREIQMYINSQDIDRQAGRTPPLRSARPGPPSQTGAFLERRARARGESGPGESCNASD
jgi:hypothetical protein